jgi:protein SCO1
MFKKMGKTGILFSLLGIPVLVFLFLKFFGDNKFDLPYYFPKISENGEVMIIKGDTVFNTVPNFTLTDQNNAVFDFSSLKNDIKIVNFFFSRCGTTCPVANKNIKRILDKFEKSSEVKAVSISIDPVFDTPHNLEQYAQKFDSQTGKWYFLTGDKKYIYDLAIRQFKLPVADASSYDSKITNIDETFIHSDKLLLIDSRGYFRGIYTSTDSFEMDRLEVEIKVLLDNMTKNDKKK